MLHRMKKKSLSHFFSGHTLSTIKKVKSFFIWFLVTDKLYNNEPNIFIEFQVKVDLFKAKSCCVESVQRFWHR